MLPSTLQPLRTLRHRDNVPPPPPPPPTELTVDRTEQTAVRRALESQQRLLARWEEAVAGQMEVVTSLQEPAQRSSLINSLGLAASRGTCPCHSPLAGVETQRCVWCVDERSRA